MAGEGGRREERRVVEARGEYRRCAERREERRGEGWR